MPFDNPPSHIRSVIDAAHGIQPEPADTPKPDRWNSHLHGTPPTLYRDLLPLSDATILQAMRDILRHAPEKWLRGTIGYEDAACVVGWVMHFTEPDNRPTTASPKRQAVMGRLYWALPKCARHGKDIAADIAAYNDTRTNATLDRWLTRAINNA